jgi:hypothetical protein
VVDWSDEGLSPHPAASSDEKRNPNIKFNVCFRLILKPQFRIDACGKVGLIKNSPITYEFSPSS